MPRRGRTLVEPLLLLVASPPLALLLWTIAARYGGSIADALADAPALLHGLPRPSANAALVLLGWFAVQWLLLVALPGKTHVGPTTREGNRPRYRLNGVLAFVVTHVTFVLGALAGWIDPSALYDRYGELLATSSIAAFALCIALYFKGTFAPSTNDASRSHNFVFDFFWGVELDPRLFGVELKQWINSRVAMMGWSIAVLSFAWTQVDRMGRLDPGLAVATFLQLAYIFKFFVWERGYFHSLDVAHDRFGFYVCWGVLAWLPAVYPIGPLCLVQRPSGLSWLAAAAIGVVGLAAIATNYAADAQRQRVRITHGHTLVWGRPPVSIRAAYHTADGREHENLLLASGFWGIARHFHYVPELVLAIAWTLPAGLARALPWFYVVYLAIVLVDRSGRDDRRCAEKYGPAWQEYRRRVPWRILPGIY